MKKRYAYLLAFITSFLSAMLTMHAQPGSLDSTFSDDGIQTTHIGGPTSDAYLSSMVLQPDGKIVASGYMTNVSGTDYSNIAIVRYNTNGLPDSTFGLNGIQNTNLGGGDCNDDLGGAIAILSDGKIIMAATVRDTGCLAQFALIRYNSNGTPDSTFSDDGIQITNVGSLLGAGYNTMIAIEPDGKIVEAGYGAHASSYLDFPIARYTSDGKLDSTFSEDGIQAIHIGDFGDAATAIAIQPDGKIVEAGYTITGSDYDFIVVRYTINGSLDSSFSEDGKQVTDLAGGNDDYAAAVVIQPDGKIIVAGDVSNGWGRNFALVRYNPNGTVDSSFNGDGIQLTDFGDDHEQEAQAITLQPNGKIIVAGSTVRDTVIVIDPIFETVRYNSNGTVDSSFGENGIKTTNVYRNDISVVSEGAYSVVVQTDGKIVAAGSALYEGKQSFALVRYNGGEVCTASFSATYDGVADNFTLIVDSATTAITSSYKWDFGDGTTSVFAVPTHTYATAGTYNVCMKTYSAAGDSCFYCQLFTGDAGFTINMPDTTINTCVAGYTADFDSISNAYILTIDSATTATATSYYWDFGDGSTSTFAVPTHTYEAAGSYNVCMKIYISSGDSCTYCQLLSGGTGFSIDVTDSTGTGFSENTINEIEASIYPNPTSGIFQLAINNWQLKSIAELSIYNMIGKKIYVRDGKQLGTLSSIDLSGQPNGIYFMQLKTGEDTVTKKIIINK